jgi:hypothetical protein
MQRPPGAPDPIGGWRIKHAHPVTPIVMIMAAQLNVGQR